MSQNVQNMCKFRCGSCEAIWFHPNNITCPKCKPQTANVACQTETSVEILMAIKEQKLKQEGRRLKEYYAELLKRY